MTDLVTQRTWASQLGVSVDTFRRWRNAGRIPMPLDLMGWPRWSVDTVERVTRELQHAGETKYFRRRQRALQPRTPTSQQVSRSLHGAGVSIQTGREIHAPEVSENGSGSRLHSVDTGGAR